MKSLFTLPLVLFMLTLATSCNSQSSQSKETASAEIATQNLSKYETAYFASGCFWCVEAIFESVKGVKEVISGYSGGTASTARYQLVGAGQTDHAEAVEVYYDPKVVSYETLIKVFFGSHDPTTLNRQGPDRGRQYRSAIFYKNKNEQDTANTYIKKLTDDKAFNNPIVTEVVPYNAFYKAEDYHQNYERLHPNNPYVRNVSIPRLKRFQRKFPELLKEATH